MNLKTAALLAFIGCILLFLGTLIPIWDPETSFVSPFVRYYNYMRVGGFLLLTIFFFILYRKQK
jgi:uncharacterized membrane protein